MDDNKPVTDETVLTAVCTVNSHVTYRTLDKDVQEAIRSLCIFKVSNAIRNAGITPDPASVERTQRGLKVLENLHEDEQPISSILFASKL